MKKCPFCAEKIQDEAIVCRYCGRDLPVVSSSQPSAIEEQKTQPRKPIDDIQNPSEKIPVQKKSSNVLIIVIVVAIFAFFVAIDKIINGDGDNNENRATMASIQCRSFVKDRLKSPSTAKFPMSTGQDVGNNSYEVSSYVDAQNSFGATIRQNWYCKIQYLSGDDSYRTNWNLLQLDIFE